MQFHRHPLLCKSSSIEDNISALTFDEGDLEYSDPNHEGSFSALYEILPPKTGIRRLSLNRFLAEQQTTKDRDPRRESSSLPRVPKRTISSKVCKSLGIRVGENRDSNNKKQPKRSSCPPQMPIRKDSFLRQAAR